MAEQAVEEVKALAPNEVLVEDPPVPQGDIIVDDEGNEVKPAVVSPVIGSDDERLVDSQATSAEEIAEEHGKTDAEREVIRERRREEKRRKKENFQNMKRELAARDTAISSLQEQLNILQRKSAGGEMAQIDTAIKQTADAYNYFKNQIAEGTSRADGAAVANATEKMIQAQAKYAQLTQIKQGYQKQQSAPSPLDPRLLSNAQSWMEDNDWYDPAAKDEDSDIMRTIDDRLAKEGWDPKSPEYWEELSRRGKKFLPHRFTNPANRGTVTNKPRQTVGGSGRESSGTSGGAFQGFVLSAARVSAIKEAGAWDDPKRRAAMIARFKEYDRNNKQ